MDSLRYRCFNFSDDKIAAAFTDKREAEQFARLKNCRLEDTWHQIISGPILVNGPNAYIWVGEDPHDISLGTKVLEAFGELETYDQKEGFRLKGFRIVIEPDPNYLLKEPVTEAQEQKHGK